METIPTGRYALRPLQTVRGAKDDGGRILVARTRSGCMESAAVERRAPECRRVVAGAGVSVRGANRAGDAGKIVRRPFIQRIAVCGGGDEADSKRSDATPNPCSPKA